ncbi:hypothetical protein L198_03830 [Cryptococcus wingfieldii CBS 7118]|uniref:RING-CH-type domain-containing protein n=1 Tax=Cryptococcus wingfieldii CBS 7118 TaxID=1295528 RepID=A0A1E3J8T6_9TREE|nr:hypothetical protein L198_03830 [Cryptococcus wingfieldii CBS 7118]ODN97267.1 hypothetical protein L198_03830 [Cryptococcus wingfieldii CBS 7118]
MEHPVMGTAPSDRHQHEEADEGHVDDYLRHSPGESPAESSPPPQDERQCRICFSGPEEEESMGKLISPCLCSGSMRKAYMECPQCHFKYRIQRTRISGLATSKPVLILSTLSLFSLLTLSLGSTFHFILAHSSTLSRTFLSPSSGNLRLGGPMDLFDDGFMDQGNVIIIGSGGGTLVWDVLVAAIQTFASIADKLGRYHSVLVTRLPGPLATLVLGIAIRSLLGIALLGSMSFLSLSISMSLFGPLQLANALRGGFLGSWGRRRLARGGRGGAAIVVALVAIGTLNTLRQVYRRVGRLATRLLKYVESQILEVNPDEEREGERRRMARREKWLRQWLVERRWGTVHGWKEAGYRGWITARGWWDDIWEDVAVDAHDE